jgi:hypothetical protein
MLPLAEPRSVVAAGAHAKSAAHEEKATSAEAKG